jgi:hypothetical protein
MFIHHNLSKNKERREKRWQKQLRRSRTVSSGALLLAGLPLQDICGQYNKFTRIGPENFEKKKANKNLRGL